MNTKRRVQLPDTRGLSGFYVVLLWILNVSLLQPVNAETGHIDSAVEKALCSEDWKRVAELLDTVTSQTPDPVLRLIKGHACLATNRNNDAVCLFAASNDDSSAQVWIDWTSAFERSAAEKNISAYLKGDALARSKKAEEAIACFTDNLSRNPGDVMSLHARGVVWATRGSFAQANSDFRSVLKLQGSNAEFWASRGACLIQSKGDMNKASEAYSNALNYSPDYILAVNGRGCVRMAFPASYDSAYSDFKSINGKFSECNSVILARLAANGEKLTRSMLAERDTLLAQLTGIEPGTPINTRMESFDKLTPPQRQQVIDAVNNDNAYRQNLLQNPLHPTGMDLNTKVSIKATPLGREVGFEGGGTMKYNFKDADQRKLTANESFLNQVKNRYGMTPNEMSNTEAFRLQKLGGFGSGGSAFGKSTQPGGVKSSEMAQDSIAMTTKWDVVVLYGLLYPEQ